MTQSFLESVNLQPRTVFAPGGLIVAHQKGDIDASFVLHYLVADFMKQFGQTGRVLLILSKDSLNHWTAVGGKLGWNLTPYLETGQLAIVDLGDSIFKTLTGGRETDPISHLISPEITIDMEGLLEHCQTEIVKLSSLKGTVDPANPLAGEEGKNQKKKLFVVIDDLTSIMFNAAAPESQDQEKTVFVFLRKLLNLNETMTDQLMDCDLSVATLVNCSGGFSTMTIANVLSTLVFEIAPLTTGYSHMYTGYCTVKRRVVSFDDKEPFYNSYQYKLEDRQIQFFPLAKQNSNYMAN